MVADPDGTLTVSAQGLGSGASAAPDGGSESLLPGRYLKRPVEVEAMQWTGKNTNDVLAFIGLNGHYTEWVNGVNTPHICVRTLEGTIYARKGNWLVKGVKGEFYPVREDIFEQTYEPVGE